MHANISIGNSSERTLIDCWSDERGVLLTEEWIGTGPEIEDQAPGGVHIGEESAHKSSKDPNDLTESFPENGPDLQTKQKQGEIAKLGRRKDQMARISTEKCVFRRFIRRCTIFQDGLRSSSKNPKLAWIIHFCVFPKEESS